MKSIRVLRFIVFAVLSLVAVSALAQYRLTREGNYCAGLRDNGEGGLVVGDRVGRMIISPSGKAFCDFNYFGYLPGITDRAPVSELIVELANNSLALEARVKSLEYANAKLMADLETWKAKTLAEALQIIKTLPFATQPSVVQALTSPLAQALQNDPVFLDELAKRLKGK